MITAGGFKIGRFFKFEIRISGKKHIVDDQKKMTLFQLASCQFGHINDIATRDLSTDDCDTKVSDELDGVNDNTNDIIKVNGKAEEHSNVGENDSNSESMENESEQPSTDEKVAASSVEKDI